MSSPILDQLHLLVLKKLVDECNEKIEKLLLMEVLGNKAVGKIFADTLAHVQIMRQLEELKKVREDAEKRLLEAKMKQVDDRIDAMANHPEDYQ